jgi:AP-2 complex subunit alpha
LTARYVDVVFKMLGYAPESVNEHVWHRVVQVVTGSEGEGADADFEELQRYSAEKAYRALEAGTPHPTLVKLSSYLLGEFGREGEVESMFQNDK